MAREVGARRGLVLDAKVTEVLAGVAIEDVLQDDQLAKLERDSARHGTQGDAIDYALLLDGLAAEREQGITIDVAYRFFGTDRRQFIVADCPGHEQYTRNMATGASTADIALILLDARLGVLPQSRRHAAIASFLGIPELVVCVNKMDLVGFAKERFDELTTQFGAFLRELRFASVSFVPVSAKRGDNVVSRSPSTPWYAGKPLLELLETLDVKKGLGLLKDACARGRQSACRAVEQLTAP